ncbi:MAG: hypothetical protein ACLP1X_04595 [Polyangiaceae bacterium]
MSIPARVAPVGGLCHRRIATTDTVYWPSAFSARPLRKCLAKRLLRHHNAKPAPPRHPEAVRVAKLHGSCNFLSDVGDDRRLRAMTGSPGTAVEVDIRAFLPSELARSRTDVFADGRFPIMSQVERY